MAHAQTAQGERRLQCMHECYILYGQQRTMACVQMDWLGQEQGVAEPYAEWERVQGEMSARTAARQQHRHIVRQQTSLLCASLIGIRRRLLPCCCPLHEELLLCLVVAIRACDLDPVRQLQARERAMGKGISWTHPLCNPTTQQRPTSLSVGGTRASWASLASISSQLATSPVDARFSALEPSLTFSPI